MFAQLLSRLTAPTPSPLAVDDVKLALAALLVRLARSDGDYAETEIAQIDAVLSQHFELSCVDAKSLRAQAETLEAEAPDTVRFTRAIKDTVAYEDRSGIVQALWSVVLADGERDDTEDAQMRLIASLLGINDRDSALARHAAAK